jgi:predicted RNase H-like HicB family nuclease
MSQLLIHPGEDGYWVPECPSLPGCVSQGATREEAVRNIREAIDGYILALQAEGPPVAEDELDAPRLAVGGIGRGPQDTRSGLEIPSGEVMLCLCGSQSSSPLRRR